MPVRYPDEFRERAIELARQGAPQTMTQGSDTALESQRQRAPQGAASYWER
jgi:hypothetical protein